MQQPCREHAGDGAAQVGLPANAGVAGEDTPDQSAVHEQHEHRDDHLRRAPRPQTAGQQVGQPAKDESARTEDDRIGGRKEPCCHAR